MGRSRVAHGQAIICAVRTPQRRKGHINSLLGLRAIALVGSLIALCLVVAPSALASGWSSAASMAGARGDHTATLLPNGKVLVAGGSDRFGALPSAELYDLATNSWSPAGSLATAREGQTATLLPSGKVLVAGGFDSTGIALASAELYDPATNLWSSAGSMASPRWAPTATLLPTGKVLVAGGYGNTGIALASAELYDPATNTWSAAASMSTGRQEQTATLLPSGKVLVAGGYGDLGGPQGDAELYDPASNSWSFAARMATPRFDQVATLLPSGKVLVAGGSDRLGDLASADLYDPATNLWSSAGSMATPRAGDTATLLPTGRVLVAGGHGGTASALASAELYDPATNSWSSAGSMASARTVHTATLLPSGKVLVAGGGGFDGALASAELYTPPPVATVPARIGTLGAKLKFTLVCVGAKGERCRGRAMATAIEKLSAHGATRGLLARKPGAGRYRIITILKGNFGAAAGRSKDISISLNSTGRTLRNKFKHIPSGVRITATSGGRTTTLRRAKVTFGADPPKTTLATVPAVKDHKARFKLRCTGQRDQTCKGTAKVTTYEKLAADGTKVIGLSRTGPGKLVTLQIVGWSLRPGHSALTALAPVSPTSESLLSTFGQIPASLIISPTYNHYPLRPITRRITFKR